MPARNEYAKAVEFLNGTEKHYLTLLEAVKGVAKTVQIQNSKLVKTFYSRGDKEPNRQELKAAIKLPKKLDALRLKIAKLEKEDGQPRNEPTWTDIPDIIGVTVVVHYPDQILPILRHMIDGLTNNQIVLHGPIEEKKEFGYYAHHANVISRSGATMDLICEIQCKSMLHDAWATKMHDLTYKPSGSLNSSVPVLTFASRRGGVASKCRNHEEH